MKLFRRSESPPPANVAPISQDVSAETIDRMSAAQQEAAALRRSVRAPMPHLPFGAGVREEAAALFAGGQSNKAVDALLGHLNQNRGNCDKTIWYMLLDVYQATAQRAAFEKLASFFAKQFGTSPPAWEDDEDAAGKSGGLNVLVIDSTLHTVNAEKVRDFLAAGRLAGSARLDLSRARLADDVPNRERGLTQLLSLMQKLRCYRIPTLLMGESQLAEQMRAAVSALNGPEARPYWLVLLELLQWRAQQDAFEDLAGRYVDRFAITAPDYDPDGVVALAPGDACEPASEIALCDGRVQLPASVSLETMNEVLGLSEDALRKHGVLRLDMRPVRSMSYEAAMALATHLHSLHLDSDRVVLVQPSDLVKAVLDLAGVLGLVTVEARKR